MDLYCKELWLLARVTKHGQSWIPCKNILAAIAGERR